MVVEAAWLVVEVIMVVVMVAWLALCGGREGGVVGHLWLRCLCEGGGGEGVGGGCCDGVVVKVVVVIGGWSQNNDSKRKTAISKSRSPMNTRIIPSEQRWGTN